MEFLQAHPWLLAACIMLARMLDVSLGTLRTILILRRHKLAAAGIGFFEILIWLIAAAQVLQQLDRWYFAVAYAGGFALGNVVGMWLEERLALGLELLRAISRNPHIPLADGLRAAGHSVTEVAGRGDGGRPVEVLLVVEPRRAVPGLLERIHQIDPEALCTLSDVRQSVPPASQVRPARLTGLGPNKRK